MKPTKPKIEYRYTPFLDDGMWGMIGCLFFITVGIIIGIGYGLVRCNL
jgi:hypothetical protein